MNSAFLTHRAWLMAVLILGVAGVAQLQNPVVAQTPTATPTEVAATTGKTTDKNSAKAADAKATAKKAIPAKNVKSKSVMDMFNAGGWAMYPLALLSICAFGLIVYNFIAVTGKRFLVPEVMEQTNEALAKIEIDKARELCEETPAPIANILNAGLVRADLGDWEVEMVKEAFEEATSEELSGAYVYINYLSVIGSLAPMLGLLGTVSGMVKAFNAIAAEGVGNPQLLADNISEALITTATGMIIGIPAMFFFFYFKNKYGKITSSVGRVIGDQLFVLNKAIKTAFLDQQEDHGQHS